MTEKEIRAYLKRIFAKMMVPTTLATGLAMAGCSDDSTPTDGAVADGAVTDGAVDQQQAADGAIDQQQAADGTIDQQQAADGAVDQQQAADGAVDQQQAADGAVDQQQSVDTVQYWDIPPYPPYMAPDAEPLYRSYQDKVS
jgi:hypothetical protein